MIKVFDAKSNKKNEIVNKNVSMYVCGPTVYNDPHIGNIRPLLTFDVLYRLLKVQNYNVHYVHNITDIDDKIIQRAIQTNTDEMQIAKKYTEEYFKLMEAFNVFIPEIHKVSDEINEIIAFIQKLIDNKCAYVVNGDVYFDVKSIKNYGEVSHNNIQDLINNVRIENDNNKKNPLDFALWKQTDLGLNWNSNWSKGRPGWHTECVVMINKYLDKQITIHGGGVDLKFPHHENENAQNYGANNCSLAQNFQYVGHLTINGQKMSKSLKNVVLAKDLLQKYQPEVIKWFFYQKYYGAPIDFSNEIMQEVSNQYNKIINAINIFKTKYYLSTKQLPESKPSYNQTFLDILNDDLNFANAVSYIQNQTKELSVSITKQNKDKLLKIYQDLIGAFIILGIHLKDLHNNDVLKEIDLWHLEVNKKNFKVADELRKELIKKKVL